MALQIVNPALSAPRMTRSPSHSFSVYGRPFQLQPLAIAPVLPGETMTRASFRARVVTDPLVDGLAGWWFETFLFYVKLTDIDDTIGQMFIDPDYSFPAALQRASAEGGVYHSGGNGADWMVAAMKTIAAHYFWDEGDEEYVISDPYIKTKVKGMNWTDSLTLESAVTPDGAFSTGEVSDAQEQIDAYEFMRRQRMAEFGFDDYLRQYGVRTELAMERKPELLRYSHAWTYPSNSVSASDGAVRSVASWVVEMTADKDRYFKEPGFIVACGLPRPKVYMRNLKGSPIQLMNTAMHWFPPDFANDAPSSIFKHGNADGIITSAALPADPGDEFLYDLRDLLMYGDQLLTNQTAGGSYVALPDYTTTAGNKYVADSHIRAGATSFFASTVQGTDEKVKMDGVLNLSIKGRQKDMT